MTDSTSALLNERGQTHGDYAVHADITQRIKREMFRSQNWSMLSATQRETLEMIAHKIGRVLAGDPDFVDHWDDIAGYSRLVADELRRPRSNPKE